MKPTFLLVSCIPNKNFEVAEEVQKNHGIDEATPVMGAYDLIVKTDKIADEEVRELISSSIRPLDGVTSVLSLFTTPPQILYNKNA